MQSTPWINYNGMSEATSVHWRNLAISTGFDHAHGRLFQHAASLGAAGSLAGAAISVVVVGALVLVSVGLCRSAGARSARGGLTHGILQGGAIACLLAVALWLSSYYGSLDRNTTYWGITAFGLLQTVVTLVLVCGLSGLVYGALRTRRDGGLTAAHPQGGRAVQTDTLRIHRVDRR